MRSPRRFGLLLVASLLIAVVLVTAVVFGDRSDDLAASGVARASSSALGHPAQGALSSKGWRPEGTTAGSWWEVRWAQATEVAELYFEQRTTGSQLERALVDFSDGSRLVYDVSGESSTIAFERREVDRVRITILQTGEGTGGVVLRNLSIRGSTREPAPASTASDVGVAPAATAPPRSSALTDGPTVEDLGGVWTADTPGSTELHFRWDRPRELHAIELYGASDAAARVARGTLAFGEDDVVGLGGVLADPARPTQVAFLPRVTDQVTITLIASDPDRPLQLAELRLHSVQDPPLPVPASGGTALTAPVELAPDCDTGTGTGTGATRIVLQCPSAGTAVRGRSRLLVRADGVETVQAEVWGNLEADSVPARVTTANGSFEVAFDAARLPPGPITVAVSAVGRPEVQQLLVQLVNVSSSPPQPDPPTKSPIGGRLVYSQEFNTPITASLDGSEGTYTAAKPEVQGVSSFGEAPFADPAGPEPTLSVVGDSYLRIDVRPDGEGSLGGMLASSRSGGSGFSAQYGYFEARMAAPIATGSWPAFWTLPASHLAEPVPDVAEFDAVELYGHEPRNTCSATHRFRADAEPTGQTFCDRRYGDAQAAATWHVYGVRINPDSVQFYVDGALAATADQVPGGDEPLFFLVNLATGGGWPVDLDATRGRLQLYVDWIRVYA